VFSVGQKNLLKNLLSKVGYKLSRTNERFYPVEISESERKILDSVVDSGYSMVSREGLINTLLAVKHVIDREIPGDFVECGVWRGGNAILAALMFQLHGLERSVYLFDTFAGTTKPDIEKDGINPVNDYLKAQRVGYNEWAFATLEEVKNHFAQFQISENSVKYVKGDVIQTLEIKDNLPKRISVLRLDTDWYHSTWRELELLFPLLSIGGCLIIDDYGYSEGSRLATDSYFMELRKRPFFHYTNGNIRTCVKE